MERITDYFGCLVFNDAVMKSRLSPEVYTSLKKTIEEGSALDNNVASAVAEAMKDWATEHGATHFTHWFQPLTGITAEKHDSFISSDKEGRVILEFSGKELIKANRTRLLSRPAVCAPLLRQEAIRRGTPPRTLS